MSAEHSLKQLEKQEEILTLIETLHQASQRLEELTGGEIDTVSSREGRKFMLHYSQDRLHEAELVRQAAILNALNARIALLDKHGVILSVNDAWRRYGAENMLQDAAYCAGCNYLEICDNLPEEFDAAHRIGAGIRDVMSGEKKCISVEYPCHTPTEELWFQATVTPLDGGSPHRVVVAHEDITSRKLAEFQLYRLNRLHSVLSKVGEAIVRSHDRQSLYQTICRIVVEYGLLPTALIVHVDADSKPIRPAAFFSVDLEYLQESTSALPRDGGILSETIVETAIRTRRHDFCNDIGSDPRTKPWRDAAIHGGLMAYAAFPLTSRGVVVAVLILYADQVNYFQEDEISLMDAVANEISFAIEMLEIEQERRAAEQLFHRSAGLLSMASRMGRLGAWTVDMPSRKITWSDEVFTIYERPLDYMPKLDNALDSYPQTRLGSCHWRGIERKRRRDSTSPRRVSGYFRSKADGRRTASQRRTLSQYVCFSQYRHCSLDSGRSVYPSQCCILQDAGVFGIRTLGT
jgi:PAS domain-containing protein